MSDKPLYVVRPSLPPFEEFSAHAKSIWESGMLTNGGPLHQRLEDELCAFLGVPYISLFNNATSGLIVSMAALDLKGEVITTPFSFIATSHTLLWNNLEPVFVDLECRTLNIDPAKIEAAITPETSAILAVHCYGNPCDTAAIEAIAQKHNLKVIYDAAHAFGVEDARGSVLNHGDLSVLSFHATKVFNTFEGGAIICHDKNMKERIDRLKNFGIADEVTINETGMNGKMSEICAAMGLAQIPHMNDYLDARGRVDALYRRNLEALDGIICLPNSGQIRKNYAYFPILVEADFPVSRDDLYEALQRKNIHARRYFYPLLSALPMYKNCQGATEDSLPIATEKAQQVLCLPIYTELNEEEQMRVIDVIKRAAQ